jgi:hypothetical protein
LVAINSHCALTMALVTKERERDGLNYS